MRALRDLVEFAEEGLTKQHVEWHRTPLWWMAVGQGELGEDTVRATAAMPPEKLWALRDEVRGLLRALIGGPAGQWPADARIHVEITPVRRARTSSRYPRPGQRPATLLGGRGIKFRLDGSPRDVLLYQVATLLASLGNDIERLLFCPAPDCRKLFVKSGRREFCSMRCQQRCYAKQYDPFAAQRRKKPTVARRRRG
jgi:predicted RNA-binding Zn ribbon-like protein